MRNLHGASTLQDVTQRETENAEIAYRAALEGIVLLKNDSDCLPVSPCRIALFGAGVTHTVKGGSGSGEVNERQSVDIYDGMINAGFKITTGKWLEEYEEDYDNGYKEWKHSHQGLASLTDGMAQPYMLPYGREVSDEDIAESDCDTAIYVVSRQAGEGDDKRLENGEFDLSASEIKSIKKLASSYKKSILVINSGSYMNLESIEDAGVSAVIFFCQQGMEGGRAFADIITGKVSPSGKLTDTWAKKYSDIPFGDEYSYRSGKEPIENYREGIYVGYRYFDTFSVEPRYHFGYGLSYTEFKMQTLSVKLDNNKVSVSVRVENTGVYTGKEVVEIYGSAPAGKLPKEYQRLVGFAKTRELAPGENEILTLDFDIYMLASFSEEGASYVLEAGDYIIRVGEASNTTEAAAVITLDKTAVIYRNRNICKPAERIEEIIPVTRENTADLSRATRLELKASDITAQTIEYKTPEVYSDEAVDAIMDRLTDKELIEVCSGEGMLGMLSTEKLFTPGAVGRTTSKLYSKGLINVNLADGPAGLRLLRESAINKHGKLKMIRGSYLMSFLETFPEFLLSFVHADPKKDTVIYQYTTAFPVGTALAQSWNTELVEQVGRAVSCEMEEYNITYWLAPAMNIHKNPLCGRNFEYLSEDPLLTGKIAAAITRGVQSIEGNYVTIKHFACNNAEFNRTHSDSRINERALREIYLKGFEICIRDSKAKSVMTSYNLLNGTYTPDIYDTCTACLRNEWGFDGVVMTDWYSTNRGLGRNDLAIKAGNDLIMPGGRSYKKEIQRGLESGVITRTDLRRAAANIIRSIVHSSVAKKVKPEMFD